MKKQYRRIALRNCLIALLCAAGILFAAEAVLSLSEKKNENASYEDAETAEYLRLEKCGIADILTSEDEAREIPRLTGQPASAFQASAYPLIDDMPSTADDTGAVKIVVIGDSFIWGDSSLNRNELCWRQAERILRAEGYNCRVYAVAMRSATAYEEISWLKDGVMEELRPDIVIFGYVYNDMLIHGYDYEEKAGEDIEENLGFLSPLRKAFPAVYKRLVNYLDAETIYSKKFGDHYGGTNIAVPEGERLAYYQEHFVKELDAFSRQYDLPVAVMTLPNEPRSFLLEELYKPLEDVYKGTCVPCYNSVNAFKSYAGAKHAANIRVNPKNGHPGSATNRFYAEYICDFLKKDFPEVLGESAGTDLNSAVVAINEWTPVGIDLTKIASGETGARYSFVYPDTGEPHFYYDLEISPYCLTDPLGRDYVKLSFENPVDIESVTLEGEGLRVAEIYSTVIDKKLRYDTNELFPFAEADGVYTPSNGSAVASLCIHAEFEENASRALTITVNGSTAS